MQDNQKIIKKITDEKDALNTKITKLDKFIYNDLDFSHLDLLVQSMLVSQSRAMKEYYSLLKDRIAYLKGPSDDLKHDLERNYRTKTLSFGDALVDLRIGYKVARKGWNGKGIFVKLAPTDPISAAGEKFDRFMTHDFLYIDTTGLKTDNLDAPEDLIPWTPSQTDILALDWYVVE